MSAKTDDNAYAHQLMRMLREDCQRLTRPMQERVDTRDWSPIVLWMAEEVKREARRLTIQREISEQMHALAEEAVAQVRSVKLQAENEKKKAAATQSNGAPTRQSLSLSKAG